MTDPLELVNGYLDNDLSDDEIAELEAWILADSENAVIFARRAAMHNQIREILAGANSGGNRFRIFRTHFGRKPSRGRRGV
jgi:hypothetical protein